MQDLPLLSPEEEVFVDAQRVARMATVYPDGTPHVVPICPALDLDRIVIASEAATIKVRNLRENPFASISFDEYAEQWNAMKHLIVFGEALLIESGPEFERDRGLLYEKFPQYPTDAAIEEGRSVLIEVRIERVSTMGFS